MWTPPTRYCTSTIQRNFTFMWLLKRSDVAPQQLQPAPGIIVSRRHFPLPDHRSLDWKRTALPKARSLRVSVALLDSNGASLANSCFLQSRGTGLTKPGLLTVQMTNSLVTIARALYYAP